MSAVVEYSSSNFNDNLSLQPKWGEHDRPSPEHEKIKLVQQLNKDFFDSNPLNDANAPWQGIGSYGQGQTASYYFASKPKQYDLWRMSRYNPIGHRIVWGFTGDVWNNDFGLDYGSMDKLEQDKKNALMDEHLRKIGFWDEWYKLTGFDREQGEAIVIVFRKGVGLAGLELPADITREVIKHETIAKQDYTIVTRFGQTFYRINFYREESNMNETHHVHTSNAERLTVRKYDYEQYPGASALEPVFGDLQVLSNITRAIGEAMYRWGPGKPAIFIKQGAERKLKEIKQIIGNPTLQTWHLFPENWVSKIQMLGLEGTMPDMANIAGVIIENLSGGSEIPAPILMGRVAGVVEGSEVNERSYFSKLDKYHSRLNTYIMRYFEKDPFMVKLIGGNKYNLDWGLQYVMSIEDRAKYDQALALLGQSLSATHTLNEVRIKQGSGPIEKVLDDAICMEIYGIPVETLGQMIASHVASIAKASEEEEEEEENKEPDSDNDGGKETTKKNEKQKQAKEVTDTILKYMKEIGMNDFMDYTGLKKTAAFNFVATLEDRRLGKIT